MNNFLTWIRNIVGIILLLVYMYGCEELRDRVSAACTHGNCKHGWYSKYNKSEKANYRLWAWAYPIIAFGAYSLIFSGTRREEDRADKQPTTKNAKTRMKTRLDKFVPNNNPEHKSQSKTVHGRGPDIVGITWKSEKHAVMARRDELAALIESIEYDEACLPIKDKVRVIELAGGAVSWNNHNDPTKGCTITLNQVDRVFHDTISLGKWIRTVAIPRIQDYLQV